MKVRIPRSVVGVRWSELQRIKNSEFLEFDGYFHATKFEEQYVSIYFNSEAEGCV